MRIVAIRHSLNKLIRTGKTAGTAALFLRRVFVSPAEVVQDTSGKQDILLQHDRHFITKHFHIVASDILSAYLDTSGSYIIKTADQVDQTGFGATGSSDDTDRLTGTYGQVDILEHRLFAVFLISKIHMIENDASIGNFHHRMFRIGKIALLIEHFRHTSCTGDTHGNHNKYHRQHHQTHQDIHTVSKKAHQLSRGHGGADDHLRTQPADQQDTSVYSKLHQRRVEAEIFLRFHEDLVNILARFMELICLIVFPHISLYHADRRHVFLYGSVQLIVLGKCLLEILGCVVHDQEQADSKDNNRDQVNTGKPCIDRKRHDHRTDHARRRSHTHTQEHLISILQVGHICRQTGYQSGCTELINIREGVILNIDEHRLSQISGKSCRRSCAEFSSHHTCKQTNSCRRNHPGANCINMLHIARFNTVIDNGRHQKRNDRLHNYFQDHENRCQDGGFFELFYLCPQDFQHMYFSPFFS